MYRIFSFIFNFWVFLLVVSFFGVTCSKQVKKDCKNSALYCTGYIVGVFVSDIKDGYVGGSAYILNNNHKIDFSENKVIDKK